MKKMPATIEASCSAVHKLVVLAEPYAEDMEHNPLPSAIYTLLKTSGPGTNTWALGTKVSSLYERLPESLETAMLRLPAMLGRDPSPGEVESFRKTSYFTQFQEFVKALEEAHGEEGSVTITIKEVPRV